MRHLEIALGSLAAVFLLSGILMMTWGLVRTSVSRRRYLARHRRGRDLSRSTHPALMARIVAVGRGAGRAASWPEEVPDPFLTLETQLRLSKLAEQLRTLDERDPHWGDRRRRRLVLADYDETLARACRLAGAPRYQAPDVDPEANRQMTELALGDRGWNW
jgi:hypothetical protein